MEIKGTEVKTSALKGQALWYSPSITTGCIQTLLSVRIRLKRHGRKEKMYEAGFFFARTQETFVDHNVSIICLSMTGHFCSLVNCIIVLHSYHWSDVQLALTFIVVPS